ncbi:MAG: AMP-binding protein [Bacteroidales bacterium]|nr:AMP-binding protein [Bacteroidales bacterium]
MQLTLHNQTYNTEQLPELIRKRQAKQLPEWEEALFTFLANWFDDGETIKAQTSGSTGVPKPILLKKESMLASARLTNQFFKLKEGDTAVMCLSANYIAGKMMVVRAIAGDLNLVVIEPTSTPIIDKRIEFAAMVPMQVDSLLKTEEGIASLQNISKLIIGGSAVSPLLEEQLQQLSTKCYSTYGMTETVSHVALRSLNGAHKSTDYEALEGVWFEQDKRDCLIIHAPHLQEEPFTTNDIVSFKSNTCFEWLGRFDNVINSGGVKLFPEAIEQKLSTIISERFYITSIVDDKLGEKVVLVIEGTPFSMEKLNLLETEISNQLTRFERPRQIIFLSKFQETSTGKIKRIITR